ncbi:DsbA family protein [Nitrosomonas sp. Nm51]|uniref:DsbA family protein n=1 Tax=Nitrosomonas sp. Nm51 TaxID=133720 RepID=UPI000B81DCAF|nr:DsbA family protein [Nitrosomonas sp. Nm51]
MCSWCYAFDNSWLKLQQVLPEQVQITCVLGGLAPDTTEPMPEAMRRMIQQTWRKIEKMVPGVRFNYDFWSRNTPVRSTYPACRAILAAKKQNPAVEAQMLRAIQNAYYQFAKNPSLFETLQECAEVIGLDSAEFRSDLSSEYIDSALKQQLHLAAGLNAFSFPSLRLLHQDTAYPITVDYLDHQTMLKDINKVINDV